jgi:hypothetical protein
MLKKYVRPKTLNAWEFLTFICWITDNLEKSSNEQLAILLKFKLTYILNNIVMECFSQNGKCFT